MNNEYSKQWLLIDSCLKKLKKGRHWMTSLDPHTAEVDKAIKMLEEALKKIEES
jgi:HEAT repeat protein|tara:strand:- start:377 stop:538 length:162 start_codon:yes stop_codon:yes gene_type:complete